MAKVGRPTDCTPEKLALAREYADGGWEQEGDAVPQIAGLAIAMGVNRATLYEWAKDPKKQEFHDIFTEVQSLQERGLVNNGLKGDFNPAITKMMLTKHGYSDKTQQEISGPEGGPVDARWIVQPVTTKNANPTDT